MYKISSAQGEMGKFLFYTFKEEKNAINILLLEKLNSFVDFNCNASQWIVYEVVTMSFERRVP